MKKTIIGGLLAAGSLLGGLAVTTTVSADEPSTGVHHPECEGLVKDIAPGVPTPIDGDVYVKAGNQHYYVGFQEAGYQQIVWDSRNIASGIYLYRLSAGDFVQTKKLILLR